MPTHETISFNQVSTLSCSLDEDLELAKSLGFDSLGLYRRKVSDLEPDEIAEKFRGHDVGITSLGWVGGFTGSDGWTFDDAIEDATEAIETAAAVGADVLTLITGGLNRHIRKHARRVLNRALSTLAPVAADRGVTLALEPIHPGCGGDWSFVHDLSLAIDIVREVADPALALVIDLYHVGLSNPPPEIMRQAAAMTRLVQFGDAKTDPQGEMNRCPLGIGNVPLRRLVGDLRDGGYEGPWEVELVGQDVEQLSYERLLGHSIDYVRDVLAT